MASAALRSFTRRKLSPKWFCKTSSSSPLHVLHHDVKDYNTKPTFSDSSLLLARSFHRQMFFKDSKKKTFPHSIGASGVFLCRHVYSSSSSSSCKPEESGIKIDGLGDVVEGFVPEKPVEAMVTTIDESSSVTEYLNRYVDCGMYCAQYVTNAIHDLTGLNWSISVFLTVLLARGLMWPVKMQIQRQVWELKNLRMRILEVRSVMKTRDPIDLTELENKLLESGLMVNFGLCALSYLLLCYLYLSIPMFCIVGIGYMAITIPEFENGGILWYTDLSTMDNFYMLPLVTALTFWFTKKVPTTRLIQILSRMKELPLYCIFFTVAQAVLKFKPAVYFFLITYKISLHTLHLMCRSKQIAKLSKSLGLPYVPVTAFDQERIMAGMVTIMGEFTDVFIDVLKKKNKK